MTDAVQNYTVSSPPDLPESAVIWYYRELLKLSKIINELVARAGGEFTEPPTHPRVGMVVYAKAPWNPGEGDGFYGYGPSGWTKLS